ncbi:MAG: fibronectin type III domain-containing protein [Phycisphaeraceae bacterium]
MILPNVFTSLAVLVAIAMPAIAASPAADVLSANETYQAFNKFCLEFFGAEHEPLTYERFGDELTVLEDSRWLHASEQSATVAWSTSLPARTVVEYGRTAELGASTADDDERPFYTHVKYLRDLEPGQTYHYRLVGVDERGNRVASQIDTFRTTVPGSVTRIAELHDGEAYRITRPGYYLVTADLVANHKAFVIESGDVTLDLGGHAITYNQQKVPEITGDGWDWLDESAQGVWVAKRRLQNVRILNGTIIQGEGNDGAQENGRGPSPIASHSGGSGEIAGVTVVWSGEQVRGFLLGGSYESFHHNVAVDLGTEITNRHQGVVAMEQTRNPHHNLVKRSRQRSIDVHDGDVVRRNEIYIDSHATNSFGIYTRKLNEVTIHDNRVFGGGYLAVGIGTMSSTQNARVFDNFVHLQASEPSGRWSEYGDQSGAYCYRVTFGDAGNIEVYDNYFITKGRDEGKVRGVWFSPSPGQADIVIRDNLIKAIAENEASDDYGAVVIAGGEGQGEGVDPVVFRNNRIISNFALVRLGEPYGAGHNTRFVNNTFERVGDLDRFRFVHIGFWRFACVNNVFVDSTFVGDVQSDRVHWEGNDDAPRHFDLAWTLELEGSPGAQVTVTDAAGEVAAEGRFDGDDVFRAELLEASFDAGSATRLTPHTIAVDGQARQVVADRPLKIAW